MDDQQIEELDEFEGEEDYLVLEADGETVEFEYLDTVDYEGEEYVVLLPVGDDEEVEVTILKVEKLDTLDEDGEPEEQYVSVESEELLDKVFEIFREDHAEDFDFVEE